VDAYCSAAFGAALALDAPLTALSLAGYAAGKRMRSEGCVALARGLATNHTLTRSSIKTVSRRVQAVSGIAKLTLVLCCTSPFDSLDLSHHGLRNSGVTALCGVLPQCSLRYINLQKNHIQHRGAAALARSPHTCSAFKLVCD